MTNATASDEQAIQAQIRQRIENLLPEIIRRTLYSTGDPLDPLDDNPLNLFVDVMVGLNAPSTVVLARLHDYFDIYSAPDRFIVFIASWFDLQGLWIESLRRYDPDQPPPFPSGNGRVRQLLASIRELTQWRGTAYGLVRFLEIATGVRGFSIEETVRDENGAVIPFHILVQMPAAAEPYRAVVRRIINIERPAHVTYAIATQPPPEDGAPYPDSGASAGAETTSAGSDTA